PAKVTVGRPDGILASFTKGEELDVWMSHGDRVEAIPPGFTATATTGSTPFAAMADDARKIYGVQFHPEVVHTPRGVEVLSAFLFGVAKLSPSWTPGSFVDESVARIEQQCGDANVVCGLSGGVDSSVAAVLVSKAIGER